MRKNKFSWTQSTWGMKVLSPKDRRKHFQSLLRDLSLDLGEGHLRFKVVAVEPVHRRSHWDEQHRVKLIASTSAIKRITSHWGDGQYFTVNGKRRKT